MTTPEQQRPRVSVIVPAYNAEQYLGECLASMCAQTERDMEVLVINDGSTDNTAKVAQHWAKKDNRIRVITTENQGASAARNLGFDCARGIYVAVQDADDYAHPQRFMLQAKFLDNHPGVDLVGSYAKRIDDRGRSLGYLRPPTDAKDIQQTMQNRIAYVHSSLMFRKILIDQGMRYDSALKSAEDWNMLAQVSQTHVGANIALPLYFYRSVPGQLTQRYAVYGTLLSLWARDQLRRRDSGLPELEYLPKHATRKDAMALTMDADEIDAGVLARFEYIMRLNRRSHAHVTNQALAEQLIAYCEDIPRLTKIRADALLFLDNAGARNRALRTRYGRMLVQEFLLREAKYYAHIAKTSWQYREWNYHPTQEGV